MFSVARDLTLDAAQAARSSRTSTKTPPAAQIKKLLDSRNDREVLDGLRKVISVRLPAYLGRDGGSWI
jgi:AP-3 complex subunit beta